LKKMKFKKQMYLSSKTITKTSGLLLPAVELDIAYLKQHRFVNAFLKDLTNNVIEGSRLLYFLFDFNIHDELYLDFLEDIEEHSSYRGRYAVEEGSRTMIVFQIPEELNEVYDKFVEGKYTKIPREYVKAYFKPRLYAGTDEYGISIWKPSKNYLILTGDKVIRKQIEEDLKVVLPEDAEVFSKPNHYEYYGSTQEGGFRYF
jgi:hypothetical protein